MRLQVLICAYAVLNAILYSTLLPLWEGFDEPFHYSYVQDLADGRGFPDLTTSRLSLEIGTSLTLAPASRPVQQNLPMVRTYSEYFSQSRSQQLSERKLFDEIDPHSRWSPSYILNYEGQQAPLAYIFLQCSTELFPVHHYGNESYSSGLCAPLLEQFSSISQFKTCSHTFH